MWAKRPPVVNMFFFVCVFLPPRISFPAWFKGPRAGMLRSVRIEKSRAEGRVPTPCPGRSWPVCTRQAVSFLGGAQLGALLGPQLVPFLTVSFFGEGPPKQINYTKE